MLNKLQLGWLLDTSLDDKAQRELAALAESLGVSLAAEIRFAASIILRSELALFACSVPRFAHRVYFNGTSGFINIRRLDKFAAGIKVYNLDPAQGEYVTIPQEDVSKMLKSGNQSCIADCLLPRPRYLAKERFHIIATPLSKAYGEASEFLGLEAYHATPFVKNITFGGGLCAQACCFMVAAILHEFATGAHGLAEITSLAHSIRSRKLSISGMNIRLMQKYFAAINLSMTVQSPHEYVTHTASQPIAKVLAFEIALRSYCLSGIPVILPVDYGRMLGFPNLDASATRDEKLDIYSQNGLNANIEHFDHTKTNRHCIVIVGCEIEYKREHSVFIVNDPGGYPFMWANTSQLISAGPYMDKEGTAHELFHFWPVTPDAVKMPLLDYNPPGAYEYRRGLKWFSEWYRKSTSYPPHHSSDNFRLAQLKNLGEITHLAPIETNVGDLQSRWQSFRTELFALGKRWEDHYGWSQNHWVWLEIVSDAIWIWDAEIEPTVANIEECLLATITVRATKLEVRTVNGFEME